MSEEEKCPLCDLTVEGETCQLMIITKDEDGKEKACCCPVQSK